MVVVVRMTTITFCVPCKKGTLRGCLSMSKTLARNNVTRYTRVVYVISFTRCYRIAVHALNNFISFYVSNTLYDSRSHV